MISVLIPLEFELGVGCSVLKLVNSWRFACSCCWLLNWFGVEGKVGGIQLLYCHPSLRFLTALLFASFFSSLCLVFCNRVNSSTV